MQLVYLAPAQRDLKRLRDFLLANSVAPQRSDTLITEIVVALRVLEDSPYLGFPLGGKYGIATPYRGFLAKKYLAIYEVIEDSVAPRVEIRRIYHTREDYLGDLQRLSQPD